MPPERECRYIPADAVKSQPQVQIANAPPSGPAAPTAHTAADDQLWAQGEAAERSGNYHDARRFYQQLAHQTDDHDLQVRCHNKEVYLSHGYQPSAPVGYQPGMPSTASYPPNTTVPAIAPPSPQVWSQYTYTRETLRRPPVQAYTTSYATAPAPAPANPAVTQWSGPGVLRRTTFFVDSKPAYALQNEAGQVMLYVTGAPGVNLDRYLEQRVDLMGPVTYRGDLYHKYYMSVAQVVVKQ
jgi:hypothetical protein